MEDNYKKIKDFLGPRVKENELLAKYSTFKIGGPADLFYEVNSSEELEKVLRFIQQTTVSYYLLGGGSNILISDKGFRGIVIRLKNEKVEVKQKDGDFLLCAESGASLGSLLNLTRDSGLTGLEFLAGIPGTIGGAIRGNAGAWRKSVGEIKSKISVLGEDGKVEVYENSECGFEYRESRFKHSKEVILEVEFNLLKGDEEKIKKEIKENLEKRATQPKEPSIGCIFVNPTCDPAGKLIETAGLKGYRIGDAQVSEKHANYIINTGKAKAEEVLALIDLIKKKVFDKSGVELKEEIVKIGEF